MKTKVFCVGLLLASAPLFAHHSFAAEFDANKSVTLKGVVAKLDWMNPHIWIYLDVKDEKGEVARWQCEGGPPNTLLRQGWTRNTLKIGDEITIDGALAKDATRTCNSRTVRLADGKRIFAGSSENADGAKQ